MARKPTASKSTGATIDPDKQYRVRLRRAVRRPYGVVLPACDPSVRVSGRVLVEIRDALDGDPIEV